MEHVNNLSLEELLSTYRQIFGTSKKLQRYWELVDWAIDAFDLKSKQPKYSNIYIIKGNLDLTLQYQHLWFAFAHLEGIEKLGKTSLERCIAELKTVAPLLVPERIRLAAIEMFKDKKILYHIGENVSNEFSGFILEDAATMGYSEEDELDPKNIDTALKILDRLSGFFDKVSRIYIGSEIPGYYVRVESGKTAITVRWE